MSLAKGVLGALLGGAIGAAAWMGVTYASGWSLSILSIVVGGAVGAGMALGMKGRGGTPAGLIAALLALVCIVGAKFGVGHVRTEQMLADADTTVTEETARTALMDEVYMEFDSEDREMTEPAEEDGYPPEVWTEADRRWHAMTLEERGQFIAGLQEEMTAGMDEAAGVLTFINVLFSFGPSGLICLAVGVSTAYKSASTNFSKEEDSIIEEDAAQAPAMFRVAADAATSSGVPEQPAPAPIAAAPANPPAPESAPKQEEPAGLGIFARLGQEPQQTAAPRRAPASAAPAPTPIPIGQPPVQQLGLINLDLGDERKAA